MKITNNPLLILSIALLTVTALMVGTVHATQPVTPVHVGTSNVNIRLNRF